MKIFTIFFAILLSTGAVFADTTATQVVSMQINSTSSITTSGNPSTLAVTLSADGTGSASDNSTSYTITSNSASEGSLKITGAITRGGDMPDDTSLTVSLASNDGSSEGAKNLSTTAVDLVKRLPALVFDSGSITYNFSVTNGWTIPTQTISRTVTLTLVSS